MKQNYVELRDLAESFRTLTSKAKAACDSRDVESLTAILTARDVVVERLGAIAAQDAAASPGAARARADEQSEATEILEVLSHSLKENEQLTVAAQGARAAVGVELDRVRTDQAAKTAYRSGGVSAPGIDLVR